MIARVSFHTDPGGTVIIAIKTVRVEMMHRPGDKGFMIFWNSELVGWVVCWQHGIKKTMEFASAYEADIAHLHGPIRVSWSWPPQGMSVRRVLDCELLAEDVVVGHRDHNDQGKHSTPVGRGRGAVEDVTLRTRCDG
jgi:hypothetical protein